MVIFDDMCTLSLQKSDVKNVSQPDFGSTLELVQNRDHNQTAHHTETNFWFCSLFFWCARGSQNVGD
jgi:hypothetical protein